MGMARAACPLDESRLQVLRCLGAGGAFEDVNEPLHGAYSRMMQVTANAPRPVAIASALFMKPLMGSPGKRRTLGKWPSTALNPTSMSGCTGGALTTMRRFRSLAICAPFVRLVTRLVVLVLVLVRHHGVDAVENPALGAANPLVRGAGAMTC